MKKLALGLALAAMAGYVIYAKLQPPPPRLAQALEKAAQEKKLVLLDFTGSDWCGWCMKLDAEALGKPEFLDYASKYLVTLVVDFPQRRELAGDLKAANRAMKSKFGVSGFPTLVLLSPAGKVVWRQEGYVEGGPYGVIAPINRARMALGLPAPATAVATVPSQPAPMPSPNVAVAKPPVALHGAANDAPKLQGILYARANPSVVLGGHQCSEGESVRGMKVVKIMPDRVTVEWEGRTEELTMH
ncbi:MAG TPA: thioredoxin fold domain-containing protein [Verrucomicrobiae bacterium]|jgi:thiol-disulfide isomerase/thioredoxin|nr:thioredoxin fold domain-containing protein [Verrucomicrobiae bacterium]